MTDHSNLAFVFSVLHNSAGALAGYASGDLLATVPSSAQAFSGDPFSMWRSWLRGRIEELAAAIAVGKPELFVSQIQWGRAVLTARGIDAGHFLAGMECVRQVLAKELPADARDIADEYLRAALEQFDGESPETCSHLRPETPGGRLAARYLLAALEGDRRQAREIVLNGDSGELSIPEMYLEVILPAQAEIGRMWLANEITVAEEHFATATTRVVLAQLLAKAPVQDRNGKTVMTAGVAGNRHDVGLQVVCDFFEMAGWKAIQLGADVPVGDLVEAVDRFQVDLLALAATQTVHLQALRETIEAVRRQRDPRSMKILIGGLALSTCPEAAVQLGGDAYASGPIEAVKTAADLFGLTYDPGFFTRK